MSFPLGSRPAARWRRAESAWKASPLSQPAKVGPEPSCHAIPADDCPQARPRHQQFSRSAISNPLDLRRRGWWGTARHGRAAQSTMLYQAYQAQSDVMGLVRAFANVALGTLGQPAPGAASGTSALRNLTAAYELIARAGLTHVRPPFQVDRVVVGNREVAVREVSARVTPFGTLLHFKKDIDSPQPRVLLV